MKKSTLSMIEPWSSQADMRIFTNESRATNLAWEGVPLVYFAARGDVIIC